MSLRGVRKDVGVAEVGCPGCLVVVGELTIDGNAVVCCDGYAIVDGVVGSGVAVELVEGIAFVSWFGGRVLCCCCVLLADAIYKPHPPQFWGDESCRHTS